MIQDIEAFAGVRLRPGTQPYAITGAGRRFLEQELAMLGQLVKTGARKLKHA